MYKVELIQIKKSYVSVNVDADNRHEALAKAKSLFEEDFEQKETTEQVEFKVQKDWNFWDLFFNKN
tara:strand:+ start:60 stop:257 length:198 start_codon:yes stop_codon:yes gene_type:complete